MEMLNMDESTKHLLDITSVFTAVGSLLSWLPHLASLFTIVWLGLRIWETATVQKIVENRRVAKTKRQLTMPAESKKQEMFMQAVANNPEFAKKVGVKQTVGKEFTKEKGMKKVKKMQYGWYQLWPIKPVLRAMDPRMAMAMEAQRRAAAGGGMKKGGKVKKMKKGATVKHKGDGIAQKGRTKGKMV
jgi:hypothetical protein